MSEPAPDEGAKERSVVREWAVPAALFVLTFLSMLWVGAAMTLGETAELHELHHGVSFAVPLMAILFAHEMGHYVAGVLHRVDISPPYFIPMPITFLGTLGAVIRMRGAIRSRNALLDVGAAGPLAGMAVAIPVLCYGIATSPIEVLPPRTDASLILEGHSIFYEVLLAAFHGTIPAGSDISLTPTALAGWAGLLVTMINLIPFGQLDGGHVAYALLGPKQDRYARIVLRTLPLIAVLSGAYFAGLALLDKAPWSVVGSEATAGFHWLLWAIILRWMTRYSGSEHPPTEDSTLSPGRRVVAVATLVLFVLLFMPSWVRTY